jgi:hypothetical protein
MRNYQNFSDENVEEQKKQVSARITIEIDKSKDTTLRWGKKVRIAAYIFMLMGIVSLIQSVIDFTNEFKNLLDFD